MARRYNIEEAVRIYSSGGPDSYWTGTKGGDIALLLGVVIFFVATFLSLLELCKRNNWCDEYGCRVGRNGSGNEITTLRPVHASPTLIVGPDKSGKEIPTRPVYVTSSDIDTINLVPCHAGETFPVEYLKSPPYDAIAAKPSAPLLEKNS